MKSNYYYTIDFDEFNVPSIERTDYMGYKFDEVVNENGHRTFQKAKIQHKRNLKKMIELCQQELNRIEDITPENIGQGKIY